MTWQPWTSYDEVPQQILEYSYNDFKKIKAKDPAYLQNLNEIWNPMPWADQVALENSKAQCSLCSNKLNEEERKTRLCLRCQTEVIKKGTVQIPHTDWSIQYKRGLP